MADAVIENPILNSPFREPERHWRFGDTGITNDVVEDRRASSYFMPIPASKVRGRQLEAKRSGHAIESRKTRASTGSASGSLRGDHSAGRV